MAKKFDIPKQSFSSVADAYNGLLGMDNSDGQAIIIANSIELETGIVLPLKKRSE